jgi:glycosyltransferase involved in cell wall biosynthesis
MIVSTTEVTARAIRSRAKVVHLHDPELIPAIPILRALGRTVVFDAHEDLPSQMLDKGYLPQSVRSAAASASKLLIAIASTADGIVAATDTIAERFPSHKTTVIKNYPRLRDEDARAEPISERPHAAVYVGAMTVERGLEVVASSLTEPSFPDGWHLDVAGPFVPRDFESRFAALAGDRARIHGTVSPAAARDLLKSARVGIVTFQATRAHVDALPTKMFEYMAAGVPIIASDFPLWRSILEHLDCATFVDETSPGALAEAIRAYADDAELLERHSRNAVAASRSELNWTSQGALLVEFYGRLA